MSQDRSPYKVAFFFLLLLAIGFRLVSWSGRTAIQTDSVSYISPGVNWMKGDGFVDVSGNTLVSKPPLYSALIGIGWKVLGDGEQAARAISFLAGVGSVVLLFSIAYRIYGYGPAIFALLLAAIYPGLVNSSTAALAESLTVFFLLLGFRALLSSLESKGSGAIVLGGLALALAVWTRSNAVLIAFSFLPVLLALFWRESEPGKRKRPWASTLVLAVTIFIALLPLLGWNFRNTGRVTLNPESTAWLQVMLDSNAADGVEMEESLAEMGDRTETATSASDLLMRNPKQTLKHIATNAYTFYKETFPKEITPLIVFLAGVGLLCRPQNGYSQVALFLPFFLPLPFWMIMRGGEPRDVIPLIPTFLVLAGAGSVRLWEWGAELDREKRIWGRFIGGTLLALTLMFCLPGALKYRLGTLGQEVEHKLMGDWIRENVPAEERSIVTRKPMVAYYAEGRALPLPFGNLEHLIQEFGASGGDLLAIDSRTTGVVYPQYRKLLDTTSPPAGIRFLHRVETSDGESMVLYRIASP